MIKLDYFWTSPYKKQFFMNKKLKLSDLRVQSFITSEESSEIKGGSNPVICVMPPDTVIKELCSINPFLCELSLIGGCEISGVSEVPGSC
jgi:hypothetical protein